MEIEAGGHTARLMYTNLIKKALFLKPEYMGTFLKTLFKINVPLFACSTLQLAGNHQLPTLLLA